MTVENSTVIFRRWLKIHANDHGKFFRVTQTLKTYVDSPKSFLKRAVNDYYDK